MINDNELSVSILKYLYWLKTWKQGKGIYGGLHVHPCWKVISIIERKYQGVTVSEYSGLIRGLLNLYKKTENELFLKECMDIAEALRNLQDEDGCFEHSAYENEPGKGGCIHNALADVALLSLSLVLEDVGGDASPYLETVKKNFKWFEKFWWKRGNRWVKNPDFPCWCGVTNQDLAVCWAMALYAELKDPKYWEEYGLPVVEWYVENYYLPEYRSYFRGDAPNFLEPAVYNGLIDYELVNIYTYTRDREYLKVALENLEYLRDNSWRDEYGLVRVHCNLDLSSKRVMKRPSIVTQGTLVATLQLLESLRICRFERFKRDLLETMVFYQSERGYFRNSTDYQNLFDIVPRLCSGVFEALTMVWNGRELCALKERCDLGIDFSGNDVWIDSDNCWELLRGKSVVSGVKSEPYGIYPVAMVEGIEDVKLRGCTLEFKLRSCSPTSISIDHVLGEGETVIVETRSKVMVNLKLRDKRRVKVALKRGRNQISYESL